MTGDGPKMVHFGPKMAKHGRLVNAPKWSNARRELERDWCVLFIIRQGSKEPAKTKIVAPKLEI